MSEQPDPQPNPKPPKRRRPWRSALISLGVVLILLAGGVGTVVATFDPNSLKPRIQDAVRQATGRELALNGTIGVKLSLWPTIAVQDVTFANPPGFSRPHMASLRALELRLGLVPLLSRRIEIDRLVLIGPDISLETNAAGQKNWIIAKPPATDGGSAPGGSAELREGPRLPWVGALHIEDGVLTWEDARQGRSEVIGIRSLSLMSDSATAPTAIDGLITVNTVAVTLKGQTGPLSHLMPGQTGAPFPLDLRATTGGATIQIAGDVTEPARGRSYDLTVNVAVPDTAPLRPLVPDLALPDARDIVLSLRMRDEGGPLPVPTMISLKTGPVDLAAAMPGIGLDQVTLSAPGIDQPITLALAGRRGGVPITLTGTVGHPGLDPAKARPLPVDLRLTAGNSVATVKGRVTDPVHLSGVELDVTVSVPALADLSPLAGRTLPALRGIELRGQLGDAPGGLSSGALIKELRLRLPEADLAGDITLLIADKPSINGALRGERVDLDALMAIMGRGQSDVTDAKPAGPPRRAEPTGRIIPDTALPVEFLHKFNTDLRLALGLLRLGKGDYQATEAHLVVRDGILRLDPFGARAPEGHVSATVTVDATGSAPRARVTVNAPSLALAAVLQAMGVRPIANGPFELRADLSGTGNTPAAIASSLDGSVSIAMTGGTLDTRALSGTLGTLGKDLAVLDLLGRGGGVAEIRCVALRFDAQAGIARSRALLLSSSLLTSDGSGSINLRNETLDMLLRPQGRVGGAGFRVPVKLTGPLRAPKAEIDAAGSAEANAEKLAGIIIGGAVPPNGLGGLLGTDHAPGGATNPCPSALALVRGGAAAETAQEPVQGQTPATPAPPSPASRPALPDPGRLLRQLFR